MNKKLFVLLPVAMLTLTGCSGDKDKESGEGSETNDIVLDFTQSTWKDEKVFPYIDKADTEVHEVEFSGYTWNDLGCYANTYNSAYWLHMLNKNNSDAREKEAFISNKTKMPAAITKVEIKVRGDESTSASATYRVSLGGSEFTTSAAGEVKDEQKGRGLTLTVTADKSKDYRYFSLACLIVDGKAYNGQVDSVTISFK